MEEEKKLNEVIGESEQEEQEEPIGGTHTPAEPNEEETDDEDYSLLDELFDEEEQEQESVAPEQPAEKTFTQSQVNELVGSTRKEARDRALRELLEKYGVNDDSELDGVFGKGQQYDLLNDDYNYQLNELTAARTENALLKSKIVEDRWEDAKAILKSKGLEVTVDNILSEALTHPEWMGEQNTPKQVGKEELEVMAKESYDKANKADLDTMLKQKPATISKVGVSTETENASMDEKKRAMSLFGL